MISPPVWTEAQLQSDATHAEEYFREGRLDEPLEKYLDHFEEWRGYFEDLLESLIDFSDLTQIRTEDLVETLSSTEFLTAFRYLAGPPISADDLRILAEVRSLSPSFIRKHPDAAQRIYQTVLHQLDRGRFPWVAEKRRPDACEKQTAIVASSVLMAASRTQADRRKDGIKLEVQLMNALEQAGLLRVEPRRMENLTHAPSPGAFCSESLLGLRKADVVIRLHDGRIMPVECKESNSSTNSIKRLNNDAVAKAKMWVREFGETQVVPAALLSGVFKLKNLLTAQSSGVTIWWAHDLPALLDWVGCARG